MGVDIDDIDCVYHYAINESITEYTQEIGRAGRKKEIKAYALSDFHKKDLDYTKWLNKSSSLTQWQIRKILEKIFYIYKECHNYEGFKSILIYPDTFFDLVKRKDKDYINNIETALLLLEKDIFNRFGDQILYFDIPETTEVFCFIRNEEIFKLKNSPYCMCFQHLLDKANGTIYKLNLEQFWKKFSRSERLGYLKYNFFKGKLLEGIKIEPRIEIKANLIKEFEKSKSELEEVLKKICELAFSFDNSIFEKEEFTGKFKEVFNTKENTIAEIILSLFSFEQSRNSLEFNYYKFIRKCDFGKYRITTVSKIKGFHDFIKANFTELFKDQQIFHEYLPINRANQLKLIFGFLELFDIVNFQVKGSDNLAFKIFIKDPRKIDSLVDKYFNNELKKVETRKNEELLLIEKFCNYYKDSNQAWEFLENYFLGRYSYSSNDEIHSDLEVKNQEFYIKETLPTKINLSEDRKSSSTEYSKGDIVNHERWGNGKVIKISLDKKTMTVNFDSVGEKNLDLLCAPIVKLTINENEEELIEPGTLVELEDLETENRVTYCIAEINAPLSEIDGETTISVDSPLGNELLEHKKGDIITIQLHTGKYKKYKIIEFVKM